MVLEFSISPFFLGQKKVVSHYKKTCITFQKTISHVKNSITCHKIDITILIQYHIKNNRITFQKVIIAIQKTGITIQKSVLHLKMIGDAHFTHFVPVKGPNR